MRSYPWAAWRGAIVTAFIIAGLIVASEFYPGKSPPTQWAHPPEFVAIVVLFIAPIVVFFTLSQKR